MDINVGFSVLYPSLPCEMRVNFFLGDFSPCSSNGRKMASCVSLFPFSGGEKAPCLPFSFIPPISLTFGKVLQKTDFSFYLRRKIQHSLSPVRPIQSFMQTFIKFSPVFPCLLFFTGKRVTRTAQPVWEGKKRRRSEQLSWT